MWANTICTLAILSAKWPGLRQAQETQRGWKERHTQLDAINKTFIQTTAVQGTIQIKKKKRERKLGKIFSALCVFIQVLRFCVYIHPLSMESLDLRSFSKIRTPA